MKYPYILKVGTNFPGTVAQYGDHDAWTLTGPGGAAVDTSVLDVEHGAPIPAAEACTGVVVTGSHAMVTENLPWSVSMEVWISSLIDVRVPFLGVCCGHQLLARACGGNVGNHPKGTGIGTVEIDLLPEASTDRLLRELPPRFRAHVTHTQSVLPLPVGATRLAANGFESCHAFRIAPCAWGVRFHPEYDTAIMASHIEEQAKELEAAGHDLVEIRRTVKDTPKATSILRKFAGIVDAGKWERIAGDATEPPTSPRSRGTGKKGSHGHGRACAWLVWPDQPSAVGVLSCGHHRLRHQGGPAHTRRSRDGERGVHWQIPYRRHHLRR